MGVGAAMLQGGDLKVRDGPVAAHKLKTLTQMCKHTDVPHVCPRSSCADTQTGMQYAYMGTTARGRKEMSPWPAPDLSYVSVPDASEGGNSQSPWVDGRERGSASRISTPRGIAQLWSALTGG